MRISVFIIIIAILTIINGFFIQCRYSIIKVDEKELKKLAKENNTAAKRCQKIKEKSKEFLGVCQLGIIISTLVLGIILNNLFGIILIELNFDNYITKKIIAITIIAVISIVELVIGFFIPRNLALRNSKKILFRNSNLLNFMSIFLRPLYFIVDKLSGFIVGRHKDDLKVENIYKENKILEDTNKDEIISNIFSFEEKTVREILIPRTDMVCIDLDDSEEYIFNLIQEEGYTRYPICGKNKDDLLGFIHIRDLYNQKLFENKVDISKILRKITYVTENDLTSRVLEKLRKNRVQMAVVVDEYGGTSGIVTVEDILEEIVGEIQDEFDENEVLDIKKIDNNSYIVQGTTTITDINKILNIDIEKDGFDSIGGWIFFMLGMDIEVNQSVDFKGYRFEVLELDKFRVVSVKIEKLNKIVSEVEEHN